MTNPENEAQRGELNDYAAPEFLAESDDPREVATLALTRDARLPDRLFLPGNGVRSVDMAKGSEYSI